ncbi:MAG: hypothetical protein EOP45_22285 [Sphingobacteriaceae bacterium]|nr:MAG: hypothetical protein EOP45_22285 [Sphingobacteriaceae bacterium]
MSESTNYPVDIVRRTKILLERGKKDASYDEYEVTFLINCLLGIVVAAKEFDERGKKELGKKNFSNSLLSNIPDNLKFFSVKKTTKSIDIENNSITLEILNKSALSTDTKKTDYNLGWFLCKLRNGIAHQHITAINTEGEWTGIKLWNEPQTDVKDFIIEFSIPTLKEFTLCVADIYLEVYP